MDSHRYCRDCGDDLGRQHDKPTACDKCFVTGVYEDKIIPKRTAELTAKCDRYRRALERIRALAEKGGQGAIAAIADEELRGT